MGREKFHVEIFRQIGTSDGNFKKFLGIFLDFNKNIDF